LKTGGLSINELSELTGIDRRTVKKRLLGLPSKHGPKGALLYDPQAALRAVMFPDQPESDELGDTPPKWVSEARFAAAQAKREEIRLAMDEGAAIDAEDVKRAWTAVVVATKQKILAIPSKAESRHVDGMSAKDLRLMLDVEVREALEEMATAPEYKVDDETETDSEPNADGIAGDVPTAAGADGEPVGGAVPAH
jgi:phage terminase Nu1 subunit (DNA packaging protein)